MTGFIVSTAMSMTFSLRRTSKIDHDLWKLMGNAWTRCALCVGNILFSQNWRKFHQSRLLLRLKMLSSSISKWNISWLALVIIPSCSLCSLILQLISFCAERFHVIFFRDFYCVRVTFLWDSVNLKDITATWWVVYKVSRIIDIKNKVPENSK